jgi:hypothetical protein
MDAPATAPDVDLNFDCGKEERDYDALEYIDVF